MLQAKVIRDVETIEQTVQQTSDAGLAALITLMRGRWAWYLIRWA